MKCRSIASVTSADGPGNETNVRPGATVEARSRGVPAGRRSWLEWLFPILCLALVATMAVCPHRAYDLWWQLKTGELIWTRHSVPHRDLFSFTAAGHPWYVHEWLTELLIYGLYRVFSPGALVFYRVLTITAAFACVYWRCRVRCGSAAVAAAMTALAANLASPAFDMRPQLFTYALLALSLLLLEQWRRGAWRWAIWLLPGVTLLWANLHSGFMLLFALLGVEIAAELWEALTSEGRTEYRSPTLSPAQSPVLPSASRGPAMPLRGSRLLSSRLLTIVAVALLCGTAALLNPNGPAIYRYPFLLLGHKDMLNDVSEWKSPNFHDAWSFRVWGFLLLLIGSLAASRRSRPRDLLLLAGLLHSMLFSLRHTPLFYLACAPILAEGMRELGAGAACWIAPRCRPGVAWRSTAGLALGIVLAGALVTQVRALPRGSWFDSCTASSAFPSRACDFLLRQPQGARLFNFYDWGGYCIWRLWPSYRVFIDGRAEVFFDTSYLDCFRVERLEPGWEELLSKWRIDLVLTPTRSALGAALAPNRQWRLVYSDDQALVFRHVEEDGQRAVATGRPGRRGDGARGRFCRGAATRCMATRPRRFGRPVATPASLMPRSPRRLCLLAAGEVQP